MWALLEMSKVAYMNCVHYLSPNLVLLNISVGTASHLFKERDGYDITETGIRCRLKFIRMVPISPLIPSERALMPGSNRENQRRTTDMVIFDNLMDITMLAGYLGVSPWTIYAWVSQKAIPFVKVGHGVRFFKDDIDRWLVANMDKTAFRKEGI